MAWRFAASVSGLAVGSGEDDAGGRAALFGEALVEEVGSPLRLGAGDLEDVAGGATPGGGQRR